MPLSNKKVALTGGLLGMGRADFKRIVAGANGTYSATLDDDVDVLVVGERPLASRVDQARRLEILIVDQVGFENLLAEAPRSDVPLAFEVVDEAPPSVVTLPHAVRVLDVAVSRRAPGPLTPALELFSHYTLDRPTLQMLRFVARATRLRQPCLLEGDTATSKTSAVLYLAALTGHEVVRINLNGQTDTSELVGRYVPNEGTGAAWRYQEGLVPRAMREGWWVILDEVNLAEPQVLERLNSVLEREPTLVLTEGPGTRFGPGGDVPVHPDFRIFGTMNPAEYQGRSILSPAYKDRWVATWQARVPGEIEYRQMLERVVFGRQPDVEVNAVPWAGDTDLAAPYEALGTVPGIGEFLSRLAALHAGLVRMASPADGKSASLGASRRERYVFTRRALLAVLDGLCHVDLVDPVTGRDLGFADSPEAIAVDAIERTYLDRIRDEEDRQRVVQLLRSLGLHRGNWLHRFGDEDAEAS